MVTCNIPVAYILVLPILWRLPCTRVELTQGLENTDVSGMSGVCTVFWGSAAVAVSYALLCVRLELTIYVLCG